MVLWAILFSHNYGVAQHGLKESERSPSLITGQKISIDNSLISYANNTISILSPIQDRVMMGSSGDDRITGTNGTDIIIGLLGVNIIRGGGGDDKIQDRGGK